MPEDLKVYQSVKGQVDNRVSARSEPFDPVQGIPLNRLCGNFLEDRIQGRIARFCSIQKD